MIFTSSEKTKSRMQRFAAVVLALLMVVPAWAQTDDSVISLSDISSATEDEVLRMLEEASEADTGFDTDKIEVPIIPENKTPLTVVDTENSVLIRKPINKIDLRAPEQAEPADPKIPTPYTYISTAGELFEQVEQAKKYKVVDTDGRLSAWVKDSQVGRTIDGIHEVSFSVGPYFDAQECKTEMFLVLQDKIDEIARSQFAVDPVRPIRPTNEQLARMIVECEEDPGQFSPDPTCCLHVLLQVDKETVLQLKEDAIIEVRRERIAGVVGLVGILFVLLCLVKLGLRFTTPRQAAA